MLRRIENSWQLVKASAAVLRADKELIIFPIISLVGVLLVTAAFIVPFVGIGLLEAVVSKKVGYGGALLFLIVFLFYAVQYFVIIFSNSALVGAAMIRLRGGNPTLADGLRVAVGHLGAIAGYSLIASTVGILLQMASRRSNALGRITVSLLGMAWNLATFLVVPVLVVEDLGPIQAIRRSSGLLKKTWGEQVVGNFGIGTFFGLVAILGTLVVGIPGAYLAVTTRSAILGVFAIALIALLLVTFGLVGSTLGGIYSAAVYRYASEGNAGSYFQEELVREAFVPG